MSEHSAPETSGSSYASAEIVYTLEMVERLTRVPRRTILVYHRHGLISPAQREAEADAWRFDDETLRVLRRAEWLRRELGVNLAGVKLIMGLLDEVDALRAELRLRRS
jgi:MerR family transcriptional regulator/heat shock protein HspR